jgi:hypothetical protein
MQQFEIHGKNLKVDVDATRHYYRSQTRIVDDCRCDDCRFYTDTFINQDFDILRLLQEMGVALDKNIGSEPTGVWCVRSDDGKVVFVEQVYRVVGSVIDHSEVCYSTTENAYQIKSIFSPTGPYIDIALTFSYQIKNTIQSL